MVTACATATVNNIPLLVFSFQKRVHRTTRPVAVEELEDVAQVIAQAKHPILIVGGGVRYSEAGRRWATLKPP